MIVKVSPFLTPLSHFSNVLTDDPYTSLNKIFADNGDVSNDSSSIFLLVVSSYGFFYVEILSNIIIIYFLNI